MDVEPGPEAKLQMPGTERGQAIDLRQEAHFCTIGDGARFVALEGRNHVILEGDPSWNRFLAEIRSFLAGTA